MKTYSKIDYIKFKEEGNCDDYLGIILSNCYENGSYNIVNENLMGLITKFKFSLTNLDYDYLTACNKILGSDWKILTNAEVANYLGYSIIDSPRKGLIRQTLSYFINDIAEGSLKSSESYCGEYFSLVYYLLRRDLIINSLNSDKDSRLENSTKDIYLRFYLFSKFFEGYKEPEFPEFLNNLIKEIKKDLDKQIKLSLIDFCYNELWWKNWRLNWELFTGKDYFEWTTIDNNNFLKVKSDIENYINSSKDSINILKIGELYHLLELILMSLNSDLMEADGDSDKIKSAVEKFVNTTTPIYNNYYPITGETSKYRDMTDKLSNLIKNNNTISLSDVENIIKYRIINNIDKECSL